MIEFLECIIAFLGVNQVEIRAVTDLWLGRG